LTDVLVAADYRVVRAGLRVILDAAEGCRLVGECGLADLSPQVAALSPDVVLVELPPDSEALEPVRRVASEWPEVGVVVLSGEASEARAREVLLAGARGYLLRDVSPEEVVEAVRAVGQHLVVLHPAIARALLAVPRQPGPSPDAESLTGRELDVLRLLAQGLPSKTIASRLRISEHTVKFHVGSILGKLGSASRTEAVTQAIRRGLIAL